MKEVKKPSIILSCILPLVIIFIVITLSNSFILIKYHRDVFTQNMVNEGLLFLLILLTIVYIIRFQIYEKSLNLKGEYNKLGIIGFVLTVIGTILLSSGFEFIEVFIAGLFIILGVIFAIISLRSREKGQGFTYGTFLIVGILLFVLILNFILFIIAMHNLSRTGFNIPG